MPHKLFRQIAPNNAKLRQINGAFWHILFRVFLLTKGFNLRIFIYMTIKIRTIKSRMSKMIREAQVKDFDAEVWRDRQTEWMDLNKRLELEMEEYYSGWFGCA